MHTLREIRRLLDEAGLRPRKRLGQAFLIDGNLLGKLLELAELRGDETVLEVGPGTGSLTEELLARAAEVVAVEVDTALCGLLRRRLGDRAGLRLICGDALASKHALSPGVLAALGPGSHVVANLPYQIATPLVAECLRQSWRSLRGRGEWNCRFDRLTFTVQKEVADRFAAACGGRAYGPVSVVAALLGRLRLGPIVPAGAFWPRPKVASRIVRIDLDGARARELADADVLSALLSAAFGQRRKQLWTALRSRSVPFAAEVLASSLDEAGIAPTCRAERVAPNQYLALANAVAAAIS
jgi:16S rRNA (adenine1518-N6/adenine1519-N6)-dimethyltransferase